MKIKKFIAPDIRRAIKMVRDEQGPDAIIISNRRVNGGVEIVSAIDYDESLLNQTRDEPEAAADSALNFEEGRLQNKESNNEKYSTLQSGQGHQSILLEPKRQESPLEESLLCEMREELKYLRNIVETRFFDLAWENFSHNNPINAEVIRRLLNCGIPAKLAREIAGELPYRDKLANAWDDALTNMANRIQLTNDDIIDKGGVIALVGPTGVGKTTTIAKLAARYALRRGVRHVGLITTDNYRVGAHEQLRTYGRLLDIPVRSALNKDEMQTHLADLMDKDLVLIDTAGMSQRDMRISEQLSVLKEAKVNIKVYLVVAATSQRAGTEEVINIFRDIELDGCILTKLDEAASVGPAISAIIEKKLPIAYFSDGQRVPEDIHLARSDKLVNQENFSTKKGKEIMSDEWMDVSMRRTATNAH